MAVAAADKVVRGNDLAYVSTKFKEKFVAKDGSKVLSTNDYTTAEKNKLAGIAAGAEVNVNADWNAASGDAQILNKPSIPSKTSELTNDSGFITSSDIPEGAAASTTTPLMDGTAAVGTELAFARGDHRHPSDTSKANVNNPQFTGTASVKATAAATERLSLNPSQASLNYLTSGENEVALVFPSNVTGDIDITLPNRQGTLALDSDVPAPATANPNMDGTAAVGSSAKYAKEDHVHPSDTSKANVANPSFTGAVSISHLNKSITIHSDGFIEMVDNSSSPSIGSEVTIPQGSYGDVLATENYVTTAIANKANKATTLAGYGITDAYTKTQTDSAISSAVSDAMIGGFVVMSSLPTASASTMGKIYLIPNSGTGTNIKDEYITIRSGNEGAYTYSWELLGTTQIDLTNYVTHDEFDPRLTTAEIDTLLAL